MARASNSRGCFKFGCFGCLGIVILLVGIPALLALIGFAMGSPDPEFETVELGQRLPRAEEAEPLPEEALDSAAAGAASGLTDLEGSGPRRLALQPDHEVAGAPGRVRLKLAMGEFQIEPGPPGEGIRVEADYDRSGYELNELYEQDDDGWIYTLELKNRVSWLRRMWGDTQAHNKIKVIVPRNHPIAFEGEISMGESAIELGGLWLTSVDLDLSLGDHSVQFKEPTARPLERFVLKGSMGEVDVVGLGNASPAETFLEGSFGEFDLDLSGAWSQDAEIAVQFSFGECEVRAPEGVNVVVARSSMSFGEKRLGKGADASALAEDVPTLELSMKGSFGELRLNR